MALLSLSPEAFASLLYLVPQWAGLFSDALGVPLAGPPAPQRSCSSEAVAAGPASGNGIKMMDKWMIKCPNSL